MLWSVPTPNVLYEILLLLIVRNQILHVSLVFRNARVPHVASQIILIASHSPFKRLLCTSFNQQHASGHDSLLLTRSTTHYLTGHEVILKPCYGWWFWLPLLASSWSGDVGGKVVQAVSSDKLVHRTLFRLLLEVLLWQMKTCAPFSSTSVILYPQKFLKQGIYFPPVRKSLGHSITDFILKLLKILS